MSSEFDGLRAILGNTAVAIPVLDAPAVEEHPPAPEVSVPIVPRPVSASPVAAPPVGPTPALALSTPPADVPVAQAVADPIVQAATPTEDLELHSTRHALAD